MSWKKNILAFIIIGAFGTLGHFLYEWTGENHIIGMFFPVNESTWEHLKLLFFPTLIYSLIEYFKNKEAFQNYFPALLLSVYKGMIIIITLFYTVKGILGFNVDFINILIYYIGVGCTIIQKNKILNSEKFASKNAFIISLTFLALTIFLFIVWSYNPPSLAIFAPPSTN